MLMDNYFEKYGSMDIVCQFWLPFNSDTRLPHFFAAALTWQNDLSLTTKYDLFELFVNVGKKCAPGRLFLILSYDGKILP